MDLRDSFSKLKKKFKHRLPGSGSKPETTHVDADGERVDPTSSPLPKPGPHAVGSGANEDGWQVHSTTDRPPQPDKPEPVPESGSEKDQGADGREFSQRDSPLPSDAGVAVGGGLGRRRDDAGGEKVEGVSPSPSTRILRGKKPDSP